MDLHILASGSSGNCVCLELEDKYIFIDAGIPLGKIRSSIGIENLKSKEIIVFVTHEHNDHISGLPQFVRAFSPRVYTSEKTAEILAGMGSPEDDIYVLDADTCYDFKDFSVTAFNLNHDAAEPFGYKFDTGLGIFSVATDFGTVSDYLLRALEGTETIVLESNYEDEILKKCSYPYYLKKRISSSRGHLSNKDAFRMVGELSSLGLKRCFFAHVSENSNNYSLLDKYAANCKEYYTVEATVLHQGGYVKAAI